MIKGFKKISRNDLRCIRINRFLPLYSGSSYIFEDMSDCIDINKKIQYIIRIDHNLIYDYIDKIYYKIPYFFNHIIKIGKEYRIRVEDGILDMHPVHINNISYEYTYSNGLNMFNHGEDVKIKYKNESSKLLDFPIIITGKLNTIRDTYDENYEYIGISQSSIKYDDITDIISDNISLYCKNIRKITRITI